jgi:hypothetical protein
MRRRRNIPKQRERDDAADVYELKTPLWRAYYDRVQRTIRFPRYYKRH